MHDATGVYLWPQPCVTIAPASGAEDFGVVTFPVTLSSVLRRRRDRHLRHPERHGHGGLGLRGGQRATITPPARPRARSRWPSPVADEDERGRRDLRHRGVGDRRRARRDQRDRHHPRRRPEDEEEPTLEFTTASSPEPQGVYSDPEASSDQYASRPLELRQPRGHRLRLLLQPRDRRFAYWGDVIYAWDINASNASSSATAARPCGRRACFRSNLINHDVAAPGGQGPSGRA